MRKGFAASLSSRVVLCLCQLLVMERSRTHRKGVDLRNMGFEGVLRAVV